MTPSKAPSQTTDVRFANLETQIGQVSTQLGDFIKESKDYRDRTERSEAQIWQAIKEQGASLNNAIERLSNNGRISWGAIISTGGFLLSIVLAAAGVSHVIVESRIRQLEIREEFMQRDIERNEKASLRQLDLPTQKP